MHTPEGLVAAYREGLGLAPITLIAGETGARLTCSPVEPALEPGEAMHARWWCKSIEHAELAAIRPAVAALEVSRSKLATWASIGFAAVVVLGWIVEGAIKWTVGAALLHFQ